MTIRLRLIIFVAACLIPLLACNLPRAARPAPDLPSGDLRKTLAALPATSGVSTPFPPGSVVSVTPAPATPAATAFPPTPLEGLGNTYSYVTRPGDTLPGLAGRFDVHPEEITSPVELDPQEFLPAGIALSFPIKKEVDTPGGMLLPDSEIIYSPSAADFSVKDFIQQAGGFLSTYSENVDDIPLSGAEIVERVAKESSTNPRLLLALLEYRTGWVTGSPHDKESLYFPLGFRVPGRSGLYQELTIATTHLGIGYYGWRDGSQTVIKYADGSSSRLDPRMNAGSVALQNLFAKFYNPRDWQEALYGTQSFPQLYQRMFGDPWQRDQSLGELIPAGLAQPALELPFAPGERWSLTGGPHNSWLAGSPRGALDFSPVTGEAICAVSAAWARASTPGVVARAQDNMVVLDLDGDGNEATGWDMIYLHLADEGMIPAGTAVQQDAPLGHPSCEGGVSTGKHVHVARKYNGEWIPAAGPVPFMLSGWQVQIGTRNYAGELVKDGRVVSANPGGSQTSSIIR